MLFHLQLVNLQTRLSKRLVGIGGDYMHATRQLHAFTNEEFTYGKLSAVGLSCGFQTNKINNIEQFFPTFDLQHPNLIVIDNSVENTELEKILKYLAYTHCPYAILFLGQNKTISEPYNGLKEIIAELNILGQIDKPIRVEDMMENFERIENEPNLFSEDMIKKAIKNNELLLYYQPDVDLLNQQIKSAEVLVRWDHPQAGIVGPDKFMPIVESTDLINELTEWIFEACLKQYGAWQKKGLDMELAINLSPKVLDNLDYFATLNNLCKKFNIDFHNIFLEVTEMTFKQCQQQNNTLLKKLRELGFKLTIDDFEMKYFNIHDLLNLEVDELKLNKVHVIDLDKNENSQKLAKSIINIAHDFDFRIGATGVESLATWNTLINYRCNHAQGYYICKPVSVAAFNKWIGISD